jgi:hypothetical protein
MAVSILTINGPGFSSFRVLVVKARAKSHFGAENYYRKKILALLRRTSVGIMFAGERSPLSRDGLVPTFR